MKAVIIEDMPLARASLKKELAEFCPKIEIIGEAAGVVSGLKLIKELTPELIFLDVDLEDGTAFDLLDLAGDLLAKIIFTTASEAHAIKAFEFSAVDYILKPIEGIRLKEAIEKLKKFELQSKGQIELLKEGLKEGAKSKIALHTQDQIRIVAIEEIYRVEAQGNYSVFYLSDDSKLMVSRTLKEYDKMLGESGFFRSHQSHLINLSFVKSFIKTEGGYIVMKNNSRIPVAVRKRSALFAMLESF